MRDAQKTLEVLLDLTARLTDDRPLEEFLKAVTDAALELLGGEHASVRLLDPSRAMLLCGARSGAGEQTRPMEFQRGEGILGWVVDHGASVRIDDPAHDPRWAHGKSSGFDVHAIMAAPLWSNGEVIGVLSVSSSSQKAFAAEDEILIQLLANCSAPPIERARLKRLALFDDLTMAYNHRYLAPRMGEEMDRAGRTGGEVSILYMDLDHFKDVNDKFGHAVGDAVLREFADRVRKAVRRVDVLIRRGGEEFVLVMPATSATQALATGQRIQQTLAAEELDLPATGGVPHGPRIRQTVSVGVATWDGRESPEHLERRADAAMYEAKRLGRNRVIVSNEPK